MSGSPTAGDFIDAAAALKLPHPGLVEKDYHVVRALVALREVCADEHRLVFGGGTSLSRAFGLIKRMSEDIDLRVDPPMDRGRAPRKAFAEKVRGALADCMGIASSEVMLSAHDDYRTLQFGVAYARTCGEVAGLRPAIKVEISNWELRETPVACSVRSFLAIAQEASAEITDFPCVAVVETMADKFVALTRRIAHEHAEGGNRDGTLLRHAYDLHQCCSSVDAGRLSDLIRQIMESDRVSRGKKFEAYAADPLGVTLGAVEMLSDGSYDKAYDEFVGNMVYGEASSMSGCMETLRQVASRLRNDALTHPST